MNSRKYALGRLGTILQTVALLVAESDIRGRLWTIQPTRRRNALDRTNGPYPRALTCGISPSTP